MIPIISIVGKSNSGKTTFIEKLIPGLIKRGYRVATIKHDVHGFEMDREGKDSWRHKKAGAFSTIISSPSQLALIRDMDHDATLNEIREKFIYDVDIILTEGYKREKMPKIEVFRKDVHSEPLCTGVNDDLIAFVTDGDVDGVGVPCFGLDDVEGVVDLVEKIF